MNIELRVYMLLFSLVCTNNNIVIRVDGTKCNQNSITNMMFNRCNKWNVSYSVVYWIHICTEGSKWQVICLTYMHIHMEFKYQTQNIVNWGVSLRFIHARNCAKVSSFNLITINLAKLHMPWIPFFPVLSKHNIFISTLFFPSNLGNCFPQLFQCISNPWTHDKIITIVHFYSR